MCRSIVTLRGEEPVTREEIVAASLQFVRKVSGFRVPSKTNQAVFDQAVLEIADATERLLDHLEVRPGSKPPAMARSRVVARARASAL